MKIRYLGLDKMGPEGMRENPYKEGTQPWHILVDFACMPEREFSLTEAYRYHGLDKAWDETSTPETYYRMDILSDLEARGIIEVIK